MYENPLLYTMIRLQHRDLNMQSQLLPVSEILGAT